MIDIPADFAERRIIHRKEMVWPDARVKDSNPQDDRHVSTIFIAQPEQPAPPTCTGGEVVDGKCVCPDGTVQQSRGDNAFACVKPPLVCIEGIVRGGQCFCPEGAERQQTGDNAYKCVTPPPPEIICDGGRVRRGECQCPDGTERRKTGDNAYRCVTPPPPQIICEGGRVRRGECRCPDGTERQQDRRQRLSLRHPAAAANHLRRRARAAWRVPVPGRHRAPQDRRQRLSLRHPAAAANHLRRWARAAWPVPVPGRHRASADRRQRLPLRHAAAAGNHLRGRARARAASVSAREAPSGSRLGDNAYRCVAPQQPEITCEGGRVRRGQCVCPEGTKQQQTGANAFQCVRTPSIENVPRQPRVPRRLLVPQ